VVHANSETYYYDQNNTDLGLNKKTSTKHWLRNMPVALELAYSDNIVAPTFWQKNQLPKKLQAFCKVIYDGVDIKTFKIDNSKIRRVPILTYGTRGMEPMRCFPQFIKELPAIFGKYPNMRVEIAGENEINYGGRPPEIENSWKEWALNYLEKHKVLDRVSWLGRLAHDSYINWIQNSWCHVYLSHPFVASWSLVEVQCCGTPIICSDIPAIKEMVFQRGASFVDHRHPGFLLEPVIQAMGEQELRRGLASSSSVPQNLRCSQTMKAWASVACLEVSTTT